MLIHNARIYTQDTTQPIVSALAIRGERILAIGQEADLRSEYKGLSGLGRMQEIDLGGKVVIPGLTDAHIHLEQFALNLQKVDCETSTRSECLERIAERARRTPPGAWILGHGWNQNDWPEGFGRAADLDAVAPQNPVYLTARSLHISWTNSAGLRLASLDASTPDPPGGRLGRLASGEPDGILFESAIELVERVIPEPAPEELVKAIRAAQAELWRMGLTGVHDFDRRRCFVALQTLHQRGELRMRVLKSIPLEDLPHASALGLRSGFGDHYLRIGGVKLFSDGALGPHTAAMLQPYQGEPQNLGMLFMDAEQLFELGRQAVESGLWLAVHAIGDGANREVLKALARLRDYEKLFGEGKHNHRDSESTEKENPDLYHGVIPGKSLLRHRIEHVQIIHPDDAKKLAQLGVVASMQPIHATSDMKMADRFWGERAALSYAWKTQIQHGAVLAFGSDAPVESPNPFWGLHAAVTRRRLDGSPGPEGWYPEQRLTLEQALRAYTTGAAYAAGWEDRLGKLSPGYLADLVVVDADPFTCPPESLHAIRPVAVMVGGNWVYQR